MARIDKPADASPTWDLFISYASEDREEIVMPLAELLSNFGLSVWLDAFELQVGDSLLSRIDEGLARSKYGVVILSPNFFAKRWTRRELTGLATRELRDGEELILPVWHNLSNQEVSLFSLPLADKVALNTADGLTQVAAAIFRKITSSQPGRELRFSLDRISVDKSGGSLDDSSNFMVRTGTEFYVEVHVINTSPRKWLARHPSRREWNSLFCGPVRLGTVAPQDRASSLFDPRTWITGNRPATIASSSVEPQSLAVFRFKAIAPDEPGLYVERFSLVCDSYSWFANESEIVLSMTVE